MLYREAGQYKTNYFADQAVFPILQDRIGLGVILAIAFVVIPLTGDDFLLNGARSDLSIGTRQFPALGKVTLLNGDTGLPL